MSKLWLIGLAASAAWTPAAVAQGAPPPPPPPPMAHGAHAPGHGGHGAMAGHGGGHMKGHMKGRGHMRGGGHVMGGGHMKGSGHRMGGGHMKGIPGGGHFRGTKGWQRFGRGHILPPHFRGGQFIVHDWRTFGWPAPMPGGHWVRYYDDALLIDGHGRIMDSRYGWDWDGRGRYRDEDMACDEGCDYGHGEEGYAEEGYADREWAEDGYGPGHRVGGDRVVRVYRHGGGYGDCRGDCGPGYMPPPPPPHPGYGHGGAYGYGYGGYGYGYGGAVVVTETTTTTAPVVETHTYYESVSEHRAAPRRVYRKKAVRHHSKPVVRRSVKPAYRAPAPRPGERG